jgi:hypothetical protein
MAKQFLRPGWSYETLKQLVQAHRAGWYGQEMKTELNPDERAAIDELLTYHKPTQGQIDSLALVRSKAKEFADVIVMCCPRSADRSAAIRKLRDSVMTANASIVLPPIGNVL